MVRMVSTIPGIGHPQAKNWVGADYLGGHPDHPAAPVGGQLKLADGQLAFAGTATTEALRLVSVRIAFALPEIRALDLAPADQVGRLVRGAAGFFIAGAIGGLVGLLVQGKGFALAVAAHDDGRDVGVVFRVNEKEGRWLLDGVQRARADAGRAPIPSLAEMNRSEDTAAAQQQSEVLQDIRALLREQNELLRRLLER